MGSICNWSKLQGMFMHFEQKNIAISNWSITFLNNPNFLKKTKEKLIQSKTGPQSPRKGKDFHLSVAHGPLFTQ